ncbi:MAG: YtxH domain-containing protein [Flavobacterium sp.]|nr:YtxH domain-containing protein [Flavobacterium sp.]
MSNNSGNSVLALLLGAAIGAGIGILFAPDKGSKTREKIKEGYDDAKDNLKHKFEDVTHQLRDKFAGSRHNLEETYEDLVSSMSHKTEDVISFLETKLADLKEQNAKLQKKEMASHNHEK